MCSSDLDGSLYFGSIGNFTEVGEYGYYYVGSHEALVEYLSPGSNIVSNSVLTKPTISNKRLDLSASNTYSDGTNKPGRELIGYNIYRNQDEGEFEFLTYVEDTLYTDILDVSGAFCYYVTTVYDQCESDSSNTECVGWTVNIEQNITTQNILIYPLPSNTVINIEILQSGLQIKHFILKNNIGMTVYQSNISDNSKYLDRKSVV